MKKVTRWDVFQAAMLYIERTIEHREAKKAYRKNVNITKCTCTIDGDMPGYDHMLSYKSRLPEDQICDNCKARIDMARSYWKVAAMMGGAKRSLFSKAQNFKKQYP